jgi:16S rRNA (guanine527-N7)-methyltransferase
MTVDGPVSPERFQALTGADGAAMERLSRYETLLRAWNAHTNLVAPSTLADIWGRHFWDSAQLMTHLPVGARTILDIGSGAGFPGLVLAIMLKDTRTGTVHLVDSTQKKCRFLAEVAAACGVEPVIHWARAEDLAPLGADVVTARAVAPLTALLPLIERHLSADAVALLLKGAKATEELTLARLAWELEANAIPSRSDSTGMVLRVTRLRRCPKPTIQS